MSVTATLRILASLLMSVALLMLGNGVFSTFLALRASSLKLIKLAIPRPMRR